MAIVKLLSISHYWDQNNTIGNTGIQNAFSPTNFQNILQTPRFVNNITVDHAYKTYKFRPLIDHFNNTFMDASDHVDQNIDKQMTKFKGRYFMGKYLHLKPIKQGFKWQLRCPSSTGYLYEFDLYPGKKKDVEVNLGGSFAVD